MFPANPVYVAVTAEWRAPPSVADGAAVVLDLAGRPAHPDTGRTGGGAIEFAADAKNEGSVRPGA